MGAMRGAARGGVDASGSHGEIGESTGRTTEKERDGHGKDKGEMWEWIGWRGLFFRGRGLIHGASVLLGHAYFATSGILVLMRHRKINTSGAWVWMRHR